jgi:hypothetical protein
VRLHAERFGDLGAHEFDTLPRRLSFFGRLVTFRPLMGVQLVQGIGGVLPPRRSRRPRSARSRSIAAMNCALASAMFSATTCSRFLSRPLVMPT